jgi:hypothetical protein
MQGQYIITLWVGKSLPTATTLKEAVELAHAIKIRDLLSFRPGVEHIEDTVHILGVQNDKKLNLLGE